MKKQPFTYAEKQQIIIEGVRAYALIPINYSRGWDVVYECYDDEDILEAIKGSLTINGAIGKLRSIVEIFQEEKAEAEYQIAAGSTGDYTRFEEFSNHHINLADGYVSRTKGS